MTFRRCVLLALLPLALLLTGLFAGAPPEASPVKGSITGTITYDGKVPNLKPLRMKANPACAALHATPPEHPGLVLGDGNTLANVFVQIIDPPEGPYPTPAAPVVIDQNGCIYHPRVVGVRAGQPLQFKNSDGILHSVHGLPKQNREFNIGMPPTVKEQTVTLDEAEPPFMVKSDVHPWMNAYVAVMSHPYFAVTGTDGSFRFDDLPPGTYTIEAWHERLGTKKATLTIRGDGDANVHFAFERPGKK